MKQTKLVASLFVMQRPLTCSATRKKSSKRGCLFFKLIAPADKERARTVSRRRLGGEDVGRVEYTGLRKDGNTFPVSIRAVQMRRDGAVVGQRGIILDVTELKRAEEGSKNTRTRSRYSTVSSKKGNRTTDVQSFVEAVTKLACELMRFRHRGHLHHGMDARYATLRYAQGLPETARDVIEKIPYRDAPYSAILIDGDPLFAEDYATFLPRHAPLRVASLASVPLYSQDTIIGALNVGSATRHTFSQAEKELLIAIGNEVGTVIAKLQADEALKESERRIRELTDALPVVVYEADATGRVTSRMRRPLTCSATRKKSSKRDVFVSGGHRRRQRASTRGVSSENEFRRCRPGGIHRLRKDGGTFSCFSLGAPIRRDGAVIGVRGIAVDITERKRAEAGVKERTHTIEALNRIMTEGNRATHVQSFAKTVTRFDARTAALRCRKRSISTTMTPAVRTCATQPAFPISLLKLSGTSPLMVRHTLVFWLRENLFFVDGHQALRVPHATELGLKSLAVVPLYRYDKRIGALNVGSFSRHTFSQAEKELLIRHR